MPYPLETGKGIRMIMAWKLAIPMLGEWIDLREMLELYNNVIDNQPNFASKSQGRKKAHCLS